MIEDYLYVLENEYRRQLLLTLLDRDDQDAVSVPDAAIQHDEDPAPVRIEFHHRHLPKLERLGLIGWDRKTDSVRKGPNYGTLRPLLEAVDTLDSSRENDS